MVVVKLKFNRVQFTELINLHWDIIKKFVDNGRKRKRDLRAVVNAIFKLNRTGCQFGPPMRAQSG